jgi:hypothetical protein
MHHFQFCSRFHYIFYYILARSPLFSSEDETAFDIGILLVIGSVYKVFYIIGVLYKTSLVSKIEETK